MNIDFIQKEQDYIVNLVEMGDYPNASEVLKDALHLPEMYRNQVLYDLRVEIMKGWDGPTSARTIKDIIAAKTKTSGRYRGASTKEDAESFDEHTKQ